MNTGLISTRYARALYDSAKKQNAEDIVYEILRDAVKKLQKSDQLEKILHQPLLSKRQKRVYFDSALRLQPVLVLNKFIDIVFKNGREALLTFIFLKYFDIYREEKNILSGKLITASEVASKTEKKLIGFLESVTNGTLEMERQINPSIIGGFILEVNHQRWDASVSGQLKMLRNKFTEQNSKTI